MGAPPTLDDNADITVPLPESVYLATHVRLSRLLGRIMTSKYFTST